MQWLAIIYIIIKIGMSDRFAYSAPPGAHSGGITRRGAAPRAEARSADSKQGQDDTERSEVSACSILNYTALDTAHCVRRQD